MSRQSAHDGRKISIRSAFNEHQHEFLADKILCVTMFSTLPQSVRDEGWEEWETQCMQQQDINAPVTNHDAKTMPRWEVTFRIINGPPGYCDTDYEYFVTKEEPTDDVIQELRHKACSKYTAIRSTSWEVKELK